MSVTTVSFAEALLGKLGLPLSDNNVRALVAFQVQEGGHDNGAWFNPLNTSLRVKDLPSVNFKTGRDEFGVQAYESWQDGLEATARTMRQGNMHAIYDSLRRSADPTSTVAAIASSPWGWKGFEHGGADAIVRSSSAFQSAAQRVYKGGGFLARPIAKYGPWIFGGAVAVGAVALVVAFVKKRRRVSPRIMEGEG
jgi:hypothetical protein